MSDKREATGDQDTPAPAPVPAPASDPSPAPAMPDFYTNPNAVLNDTEAMWRFGKRPDYARTRKVYAESKKCNHEIGSLANLAENLVKNWEIEASFKTRLSDWRTINHDRYTFAMNGGPNSDVGYMLKQGTYNAILPSSEYYCPKHNDISVSHKVFKRMMPTFAWEVLEVYSGPPKVAFRWRHWGWMKSDYTAFNSAGEKVTAKAHGGMIDIEGLTVADLDEAMKIVHLETWFDPLTLFGQIAPNGVTKVSSSMSNNTSLGMEDDSAKREYGTHPEDPRPESESEPARGSLGLRIGDTYDGYGASIVGDEGAQTGASCPFVSPKNS